MDQPDRGQLRRTQRAVLAAFRFWGPMHHELLVERYETYANHGWPHQSASGLRTRTSELVNAGFLTDSGRTVRLASGRHSIVWQLDQERAGRIF